MHEYANHYHQHDTAGVLKYFLRSVRFFKTGGVRLSKCFQLICFPVWQLVCLPVWLTVSGSPVVCLHLSPLISGWWCPALRVSPNSCLPIWWCLFFGCLSSPVSLHIWLVVPGSPDVSQFMPPNLAVWLAVFGSPLCLSSFFSFHLCRSLAGDVGICFPARLLAKGNLRV